MSGSITTITSSAHSPSSNIWRIFAARPELDAGIESALMDDRVLCITRREKDFQIASELSSFICDLSAIEGSR
jgi:hypothetical protein